jgi:hypothetical protein
VAGQRSEAPILAYALRVGILLRGFELDAVDVERKLFDGLFDEVGVLVADVLELRGGDADVESFFHHPREPRRFQPGLKGLAIDLLFERTQDADPLVQHGAGRRDI